MNNLQRTIDKLIEEYKTKYDVIGVGRNRIVFIKDEHWVIKLPLHEVGIFDQYAEEDNYILHNSDGIYAKCSVENVEGIPVLKMERVKPVESSKGLPHWVSFIDCQQVGYTPEGRLVAYDSAYN